MGKALGNPPPPRNAPHEEPELPRDAFPGTYTCVRVLAEEEKRPIGPILAVAAWRVIVIAILSWVAVGLAALGDDVHAMRLMQELNQQEGR